MPRTAIDTLVEDYIRSDYARNGWGQSSDDWINDPDRAARCDAAASYGADGSTHREIIEDWRGGLRQYLEDKRTNKRSEYPYRVEDAMLAHFDAVEDWHEKNGSIDEEVG